MIGTNKLDHSIIASHQDEEEDAIVDDTAAASRLTAAALHLMSAYAQCACPKLAVVVEAHIAELARVTPDACIRAVCEALPHVPPRFALPKTLASQPLLTRACCKKFVKLNFISQRCRCGKTNCNHGRNATVWIRPASAASCG
jgi:hypothetical protein